MPLEKIILGLGGLCWLSMLIWSFAMIPHRAPGVSIFYLMTHGHAFWSGSAFTDAAAPHHRRFLISAGGFFLCIIALGAVIGASYVQ